MSHARTNQQTLKNAIWHIMLEKYPFIANEKNQGLENQIRQNNNVLMYASSGSAFKDFVINARAYLDNNHCETAIHYLIRAEKQKFRAEKMGFRPDTQCNLLDLQSNNLKFIEQIEHDMIVTPLLDRLSTELELETNKEKTKSTTQAMRKNFLFRDPDLIQDIKGEEMATSTFGQSSNTARKFC